MFNTYDYSWSELRSLFAQKKPVTSIQGYLVCSPDRRCESELELDKAFYLWVDDCMFARCQGLPVSEAALQEILTWKDSGNTKRFDKEQQVILATAKKIPNFSWSHSALEDFENCPLSFAHKRFYKDNPPEPERDYLIDGNRKHKALELAAKGEAQPQSELDLIKPYMGYVNAILAAAQGGELLTEFQMAITEQMKPCDWFAKTAWGRGIVDVAIIKDDTAWVFDYKTGKMKNNPAQLKLFCAFLALYYPQVKNFHAKFIWLKEMKVTGLKDAGLPEPLTRELLLPIWQEVLGKVARMKQAWDSETWQAKPSGLCPYCGHYEKCKYKR